MKRIIKKLCLAITILCLGTITHAQEVETYLYQNIEFNMPKVNDPVIPLKTANIKDFGAVAGGLIKNTEVFRKAIETLSNQGGGKLIVPRGIWLTGPIQLKSNINLHIESGALLLFSKDFNDYPLVETSFEGLNTIRTESPISARNVTNIAITGNGVIDGNGDAWRFVKKSKMTDAQWKKLVESGGILSKDKKTWFPSESSLKGFEASSNFNVPDKIPKEEYESVRDFLRPVMISIVNSKNILLDGPTFQNSPAWNIHPLMCENVIIRNINVRNPWYSQNGDGLDIESCKNVLVYNNTFDVGDDAICIKSGKDKDGRDRGMPTENVIIKNNTVYHAHGGVVVGSEMSGGVKNIHVSDCIFIGTDIGIRFKTARGRGGIVENIYVSNIDMIGIPAQVISFNMFYEGKSPIPDDDSPLSSNNVENFSFDEKTPTFRNVFFKNINAVNSYEAFVLNGITESTIKNIIVEDSFFSTEKALSIVDSDQITFKNVTFEYTKDYGATIYNSKNIDVKEVLFKSNLTTPIINIQGEKTEKIQLPQEIKKNSIKLKIGKTVPKKAVK